MTDKPETRNSVLIPQEKRWALVMAVVLSLAISAPYLFALALRPRGGAYMGYVFNPDEPNVYMSWMKQASEGKFFMEDLFTTEPQTGRFFNLFFLLLGWVARLTAPAFGGSPPLPIVYHVARVASVTLLLYSLYLFSARITDNLLVRRAAVYLAATASGLGWLVWAANRVWPGFLAGVWCVDIGYVGGGGDGLVMPEANTFLSSLLLPHFAFSMALMLLMLGWAKDALDRGDLRAAVRAGLAGLLLGHIHTYDMIPMGIVLAAYAAVASTPFWPKRLSAETAARRLLALVVIAVLSAPGVVYQIFVFQADPIFRQKGLTITASPPLTGYLVSFGLPLLLAAFGAMVGLRERGTDWALPILWAGGTLGAAYLPTSVFSFQRKMVEGIHLPICLLAAGALGWLLTRVRGPLGKYLVVATLLLCMPSTFAFLGRCFSSLAQNNSERLAAFQPPYYLPRDDVALLDAFDGADLRGPILCLPFIGSYVPGLTGEKVYVGHWAETLGFAHKARDAVDFFHPDTPMKRKRAILGATGVRWVFMGEYERQLGFGPAGLPLREEIRRGGAVLYRVVSEGAPYP